MHIGITGASGFIGRHLCEHLERQGKEVTAFVRRAGSMPSTSKAAVRQLELTRDRPLNGRHSELHCLVHLAGLAHGKEPAAKGARSDLYNATNAAASIRVAEDAARLQVSRFVYVSSIAVYGQTLLNSGEQIREDHRPLPSEPYGESKLRAEHALLGLAEELGMELVIVRPALVVGAHAPGTLDNLGRFIRSGFPIPVGRPPNERSFIGLSDLSEFISKCITAPAAAGQTLLAADPEWVSTERAVHLIAEGMGKSALIVPVPRGAFRLVGKLSRRSSMVEKIVGDLRIDPTKSMATLDWKPARELREEFITFGRCFA